MVKIDYNFFCCRDLIKISRDFEFPLRYNPETRLFFLDSIFFTHWSETKSKSFFSTGFQLFFCPFCGSQFLPDLTQEWKKILKQTFRIKDPYDEKQIAKISKDFKSDLWWIKMQMKLEVVPRKNSLDEYKNDLLGRDWDRKQVNDFLALEKKRIAALGDTCCTRLYRYKYGKGCCPTYPEKKCFECPIQYEPEKRRFKILNYSSAALLHDKERKKRVLGYHIFYCPWCGKKMPSSLAKEWTAEVKTKFEVKDIFSEKELEKISEDFKTEKWWRKKYLLWNSRSKMIYEQRFDEKYDKILVFMQNF